MNSFNNVGKLTSKDFDTYIFPYLGASNEKVLVWLKYGVDAAVVDLDDKLMLIAKDPYNEIIMNNNLNYIL